MYLTRAQILAERAGDQSAQANTLIEIGLVHRDRGGHADALLHGQHALRIAESIPDLIVTVEACLALAEINSARGDPDAAVAFARRAIAISGHSAAARAHDVLGDVEFAHGHPAEAAAAWRTAVERYDELGNPTRAAVTRTKLQRIPGTGVDVPQARSASRPPIDATVDRDVGPTI
jgi:tetratricopeptide (TPR) repeat protein